MDDHGEGRGSRAGGRARAAGAAADGAALGSELADFQAGCGRRVQLTGRGWTRFDKERRKLFLEWFAATCNAKQAARRAGVGYSTVYQHRMDDARFAEAWDRALEQGYARLEAKLLQMQFEAVAGEAIGFDGGFEERAPGLGMEGEPEETPPLPGPLPRGGELGDAPDPGLVDPVMAMQLLRQHRGEVAKIRGERDAGAGARRGARGTAGGPARAASDAEVRRALVRSLRAFGVRVAAEDLKGEDREARGGGSDGDR